MCQQTHQPFCPSTLISTGESITSGPPMCFPAPGEDIEGREHTVSYEDRKSTWNSGVRKAIRRGSAEQEVRKHRDRVTGAWKQISKQRRRVDVSYDPSMVTFLQHGIIHEWMRSVSKRIVSGRRKKGETSTSLSPVHG